MAAGVPVLPGSAPKMAGFLGSQGQTFLNKQNKLFDENNANLDWITGGAGGPTSSPLYQSFLTKTRTATANAYDNAMINSRANASARGFGYASPNEGTAELGIRGAEASKLGEAPSTALQETMPYDLQAMNMRANEAGTLGAEGMGEMGMYNQDEMERYKQQQQNKRGLYSGLAKLAGTVLGGPIGGELAGSLFGGGGDGGTGVGGT